MFLMRSIKNKGISKYSCVYVTWLMGKVYCFSTKWYNDKPKIKF
jgi:hypothetical protein